MGKYEKNKYNLKNVKYNSKHKYNNKNTNIKNNNNINLNLNLNSNSNDNITIKGDEMKDDYSNCSKN